MRDDSIFLYLYELEILYYICSTVRLRKLEEKFILQEERNAPKLVTLVEMTQ